MEEKWISNVYFASQIYSAFFFHHQIVQTFSTQTKDLKVHAPPSLSVNRCITSNENIND